MVTTNTQQTNKTTPQEIQGTIKISNGKVINISSHAFKNNESKKSSRSFVKELKKAIEEEVFKKEDEFENRYKSKIK